MKLNWTISPCAPQGAQAEALEDLWKRDRDRSPFSAPTLLTHLALRVDPTIRRLAFAYGHDAQCELHACLPLYLDNGGVLRLLHYRGSDQSSVLCAPGLDAGDLAGGIVATIAAMQAAALYVDRVPPGSLLLDALRLALQAKGWRSATFQAAPNPCLRVGREDGGSAALVRSMRSHKKFDYFERRLRKEPGYAFEALEGGEGLDAWVREFCDAHDWSWCTTATPSIYRDSRARTDLLHRLRAWASQAVLVRFSLRLANGRAAFAICLLAPNRLIYHHVTISPAYAKHSAGHVLLRNIAEWMVPRTLTVLDFGVGHEDYKQRYCNAVDRLHRVYGAASLTSSHLLRGRIDQKIRANPVWQELWDRVVNGTIRGRLVHGLRNIRQRLHTLRAVHLREPLATRIALFRQRLSGEEEIYFISAGSDQATPADVQVLDVFDVLCMLREEQGLPDAARAGYYQLRFAGWVPYGIVERQAVVQACWIGPDRWEGVPENIGRRVGRLWCIRKCVTARAARGRGMYSRVLAAMLAHLPADDEAIIYTQPWNVPSQRGILRAGFWRIGSIFRRRGSSAKLKEVFVPAAPDTRYVDMQVLELSGNTTRDHRPVE